MTTKTSGKRKTRDFADRRDFKRIRHLYQQEVDQLDKLRYDLQESVERTIRIQQAFVKQLQKQALYSNRIKHIINQLELVWFYSDSQRKILDVGISDILQSKEKEEERLKQLKEEERKKRVEECSCLDCLGDE